METHGQARRRSFRRFPPAAVVAAALLATPVSGSEAAAAAAELALRLGLADIALERASAAMESMPPGPGRDRVFLVAAAAKERGAAPSETLSWLENQAGAPPAAEWFRGRALLSLGRTEEAAETLRRFVSGLGAGDPVAGSAREDLAHALSLLGENAEASRVMAEAADGEGAPADAFELATRIADGGDAGLDAPPSVRALALAAAAAMRCSKDGPASAAGSSGEALALAEKAVETAGDDPAVLSECRGVLLGLQALRGESGQTLETARLLVSGERSGGASAAVLAAASSLLARGEAEDALALADLHESSFSLPEPEPETQRLRALALEKLDRAAEAVAAWDAAAEAATAQGGSALAAEARIEAARLALAAGRTADASARLASLREAGIPGALAERAAHLEAECLAAAGSPEAPEAFERAAGEAPGSPEAREAVVRAAETAPPDDPSLEARTAAADAAIAEMARAAVSPDDTAAVLRRQAAAALATALKTLRSGDPESAVANLEIAAAIPDGGAATERAKALLPGAYQAAGRVPEALASYDIFTNQYPTSIYLPDLRFWRASRAFDSGDWDSAADSLAALCAEFPASAKTPHAIYLSAVALLRAGRVEESIEAVDRLAAADPDSPLLPQARFMQADALASLMRFDAAALAYSRVTATGAADPALPLRASMRRADCLYALGGENPAKRAESLAIYRQVFADPACAESGLEPECRWKIGRALAKDGDGPAALGEWFDGCIAPFENEPSAAAAPWYSRAVFSAAAELVAEDRQNEAAALLARLAASADLPGREEAARRLETLGATP